jgi:hypothetical protein
VTLGLLTLKEEHRFRVFQNRALRRKLGSKMEAEVLHPEDGGSMDLRNVDILL